MSSSSKLIDTEPGGEQTQYARLHNLLDQFSNHKKRYEGINTFNKPPAKQEGTFAGQISMTIKYRSQLTILSSIRAVRSRIASQTSSQGERRTHRREYKIWSGNLRRWNGWIYYWSGRRGKARFVLCKDAVGFLVSDDR